MAREPEVIRFGKHAAQTFRMAVGVAMATAGCAAVSGLDEMVFDLPGGSHAGGGGTGGTATGTGTGTGTGSGTGGASGGVVDLTGSLDLGSVTQLAAHNGMAYVGGGYYPVIRRVEFPSAATQDFAIPAAVELEVLQGLFADEHGVIWTGMRASSAVPAGVDQGAIGGFQHDGSGVWSIGEVCPGAPCLQDLREVAGDASGAWANGNNSEVLRFSRGCTGTGVQCDATELVLDGYATMGGCFALDEDARRLFHLQYGSVHGADNPVIGRIAADSPNLNEDYFIDASNGSPCTAFGGSFYYGHAAQWNKVLSCDVTATAPCIGSIAWSSQEDPPVLPIVMANDGVAVFFATRTTDDRSSIRRLGEPLEEATVLADDLDRVVALAVDDVAVYWLEGEGEQRRLRAIAK